MLSNFQSITLEEMDNVKLMERTDTKYLLKSAMIPSILNELADDYLVLEVEGQRASRYESLYFDTEDFQLYLMHHNGRVNRHKIRSRKYVESNLNYFEIKTKNNKYRTIKQRIRLLEINSMLSELEATFLAGKINLKASDLVPVLWSNCSRITLVSKHAKERVTIDVKVNFKSVVRIANPYQQGGAVRIANPYQKGGANPYQQEDFKSAEKEVNLSMIAIAEVKREKQVRRTPDSLGGASPFISLMKKRSIRENSISKYCLGVLLLFDNVKRNTFKHSLTIINKLSDGAISHIF